MAIISHHGLSLRGLKHQGLKHGIEHITVFAITKLQLMIFIIGGSLTCSVHAQDTLDFKPFVNVNMGYSDNLGLTATNKSGGFYADISPGFSLNREAARIKTRLNYKMQNVHYLNSGEQQSETINHNLFALLSTELLQKSIFLDLDASVTQQLLDSRKSASEDNISGSDNLTDTYTYSINPYWKNRWSNWATSQLSYNFNEVRYDSEADTSGDNSKAQIAKFAINSGKAFKALFWNLDLSDERVRYAEADNSHSSSFIASLGYRMSSRTSLKSYLGFEDHREEVEEQQGENYGLGLIWTPSNKTHLEFSLGHRFYGETYDFTFRHKLRRMMFNFKYNESITNVRAQIRENNLNSQSLNQDNEPQVDIPLNSTNTFLYISKRFTGDINYQLRKSSVNFAVFYETRLFELSESDEKNYGLDFNWKLKLGKRMSATTSLSWKHSDLNSASLRTDDWLLSWSLDRQLSRKMNARLLISQRHKSATIDDEEFDEFRFFISLQKTF